MTAVKKAQICMETTYNKVIGLTEEDVVIILGAPQKIEEIGSLRIYHYYQSYGVRSNAFSDDGWRGVSKTTETWESYDKVQVIFKDGKAIEWKGNVER
jgi:hypothetical protein